MALRAIEIGDIVRCLVVKTLGYASIDFRVVRSETIFRHLGFGVNGTVFTTLSFRSTVRQWTRVFLPLDMYHA